MTEEREEAAVCQKDEGYHGREWHYQQRDNEDFPESVRSLKMRNKMALRTLHWGYSSLDRERRKGSMESHMLAMRVEEV